MTVTSIQSLAGKLNFIAKAFPMGRPFICHLYDISAGKHPQRMLLIPDEVKSNLQLWHVFLSNFKDWLPILDKQQRAKAGITVFTDASANPKLGWGIYVPKTGCRSYGQWNVQYIIQNSPSIDFLEIYAILVFLDMKGPELLDTFLFFKSDNMPTVDTLTNKSSKSKELMIIIRAITLICITHTISFKITHVPGYLNSYADHLLVTVGQISQLHSRHQRFAVLETLGPCLALTHRHAQELIQLTT